MSETCIVEITASDLPPLPKSYVTTAAEAVNNWRGNYAKTWYEDGADPGNITGNYAFQRLRQTLFTPKIDPKFKLQRDDKFYTIGSCFARALESRLLSHKIAVESAAPEFAMLEPASKKGSIGLGFTNKYNTFSILNELRWALDPDAIFPIESIAQVTETTWFDPHTTPMLKLTGFQETLDRRSLLKIVTKRITNCRAVVITLGLVEVWRDLEADVYINCTPVSFLLRTQPDRYEFHLTSYTENWANLEAIYALLSRYGHPDLRIVVTVSPVALLSTFSTMDVVVANTYAKSLLRTVAQDWATTHENVDYFPSYEIVQNSDRAAVWQPDLRHVTGTGGCHIMELFIQSYFAQASS